MFELEIHDQEGNTTLHQLGSGVHSLGKDDQCDIPLSDPYVSRRHAELVIGDRGASIKDADSTNGTWYGAERVAGHRLLQSGDSFRIGGLTLTISRQGDGGHATAGARAAQAHADRPTPAGSALPVAMESEDLQAFKRQVHVKVLEYLDLHKRAVIHTLSPAQLRQEATQATREVIRAESLAIPAGVSEDRVVGELVDEAIGLGPIEPLLQDETVTEVMVNGPDHVYVERDGKIEHTGSRFSSTASLMSVIERVVTPLGRRIDEGSPMVDARLSDGSRVNAIIPPLSLVGPVLTIRKFAKRRFTVDHLIANASLSAEMAEFLKVCVEQRRNIVVSGGTGSGKTTTLNVLSNFIPHCERIVTIEDAAELQLHQEHVVSLESRPANVEGKGSVTIRDLVRNALRMRPDRIVVGECRGGEALDMLQAMNTGHDGSMTTGHANSPRDFLSRLEVMVLMSGIDLPVRAIREQVASAVDIILQQTRFSDGKRRITGIVEVDGMEGDVILLQKIFEFRQQGRRSDGTIAGEFAGCGYAPSFYTELEAAGEHFKRSIFGRAAGLPDEVRLEREGNDAME